MAQAITQRATGVTRLKGPTVVTMRGAGSAGHDALTVGAGIDVGFSVQIPSAQTANALTIEKPDGTVIFAINKNGGPNAPTAITASGAVAVRPSAEYSITKAGVAALTLAAPTTGTDDGVTITIVSATANAHTVTATGLLQTGAAATDVATFAAFAGARLVLRAYLAKWQVVSSVGITFS